MDPEQRYQKFKSSGQEPLRLTLALEGFFQDRDSARREIYGQYLRRRLQPAVSELIQADNTAGLAALSDWFTAKQTDGFIALARQRGKTAALVWLLRFKGEHFGYVDRDFSL